MEGQTKQSFPQNYKLYNTSLMKPGLAQENSSSKLLWDPWGYCDPFRLTLGGSLSLHGCAERLLRFVWFGTVGGGTASFLLGAEEEHILNPGGKHFLLQLRQKPRPITLRDR